MHLLQQPMTHTTQHWNISELFNIIPKEAEKKSTNRYNGQWCEVEKEPE